MAGGGIAAASGSVVNGAGGRFVATQELTAQQEAFVAAYLSNGGRVGKAAEAAGYAVPGVAGSKVAALPHVQAAIFSAMVREGMPLALAASMVHARMIAGEQEATGPLVQAVRLAYERAGLVGRNARQVADDGGKPLGQMSLAEIRAELARGAA